MNTRIAFLTLIAMIAFAGNSVLCRLALSKSGIDPASFTSIRLISGAAILWLIVKFRHASPHGDGNWLSALALFVYAACFSIAYVNLPAAMGALLLFGAVQATMIGHGIWSGERLGKQQITGLLLALVGLVILLLPGLSAPPLGAAIIMFVSGAAWGIYSLRGKGSKDPTNVTAQNFLRAVPFAILLSLIMLAKVELNPSGIYFAIASGALTSGIGYALWYAVLPSLKATTAATVQLSVPVITALGGVLLLSESTSMRMIIASVAILGGIALVVLEKKNHFEKTS